MDTQQNALSVPVAIVVAGLLIAAALFFALRGSSAPTNNQAAAQTQPAAVGMSLRPVSPTEHIRGNPNASLVLVEYSDLECPFCKTFHTTMR